MRRFKDNDLVVITDIEQDTPEWLEWRNQGLGSSDVALLMSPEPIFDRTVNSLWRQRVGYQETVKLDNEHVNRGKELEPIIRDKVNDILNTNYEPFCVERVDMPYLRASLDGFDESINSILEIKSPSERIFKEYLNKWEVPFNYYCQMQYQMLCTNADMGYFAFFNKDIVDTNNDQLHENPYIITVPPNIEFQLKLEANCALFWKAVENKVSIGWNAKNELQLFETKPLIVILLVKDNNEYNKVYRLSNKLIVRLDNDLNFDKKKTSFLVPIINESDIDYKLFITHDVIILSTRDTVFSKNESYVKLTASSINDTIMEELAKRQNIV